MIEYFTQNLIFIYSIAATIAGGALFYIIMQKLSDVEGEIDELEEDVDELEIETHAFEDEPSEDEEDLFQENIHELAERLFNLLKSKHDVKGVTTYQEMAEFIEEMDSDDPDLKSELLEFYDTAIRLEYSDEDLSDDEKEKMKRNAIDLIKRTGQDL